MRSPRVNGNLARVLTSRYVPVVAVLLIVGVFLSAASIEKSRSETILENGLNLWQEDLALALWEENQPLIHKITKSLFPLTFSSIELRAKNKLIYSFPSEQGEASHCFLPVRKTLSRYGAEVGTISACLSPLEIAKLTMTSPMFILGSGLLCLISLLSALLPMVSYKNSILEAIASLERWSVEAGEEEEQTLKGRSSLGEDDLGLKLLDLVQMGVHGKIESERAKGEIFLTKQLREQAAQVAHDIRSPLSALEMITSDLSALPEDKRVIFRSAANRIKDIANGLLQKHNGTNAGEVFHSGNEETVTTQLLPALIDNLVTEKRTQFRSKIGIEIHFDLNSTLYGLFARVQLIEMKRVLSNLINNSVEALADSGKINITLVGSDSEVKLAVLDNGKGISPEVLPKLTRQGESHGKSGGNGLGLYHARQSVERWGGRLVIESQLGEFTRIEMILPRSSSPHWFVPKLIITPESKIVILDDDSSIHQIWQERFESAKLSSYSVKIYHFSTIKEVREWSAAHKDEHVVYLFDYELTGETLNGLELIEELGIQKDSILVTSRYEEKSVRETCKRLNVKLIPKGMAGFIPMIVQQRLSKPDAILIDDDILVHMLWKSDAKNLGKSVEVFFSPGEFQLKIDSFDRTTPIYIDSNLENGLKGEDVAKILYGRGFKEIYLATGYEADQFPEISWIKKVVGKTSPF